MHCILKNIQPRGVETGTRGYPNSILRVSIPENFNIILPNPTCIVKRVTHTRIGYPKPVVAGTQTRRHNLNCVLWSTIIQWYYTF